MHSGIAGITVDSFRDRKKLLKLIRNAFSFRKLSVFCLFGCAFFCCSSCLFAADSLKTLPGHVPVVIAEKHLLAIGELNATNQLNLAIGLPVRNRAELDSYVAAVSDPQSPVYRHYLTPDQFTERFGPTEKDYQKVINFAEANGLEVTARHQNRLVLDVRGSPKTIGRAFHVTLRTYHHPTEARDFYAPDTEPTVATNLPILDISGLNNYSRPKPQSLLKKNLSSARPTPKLGSGPGGTYFGDDFRTAYAPGSSLTGAGQLVGLVQFDGFYPADISNYVADAGLTNVPLLTVLLDGYDGAPSAGTLANGEVSLDIEMSICMAPGLAGIVLFEAGPNGNAIDVLDSMVSSNQIQQFSCSWGLQDIANSTMDSIFEQMAVQGQTFFNASGDSDAFTTGSNSVNGVDNPFLQQSSSSSPYIMQVGGTTLYMRGVASNYASEKVWNWGGGKGSSGGISSAYAIPAWQQGIDFSQNLEASPTQRNIPDVALTADNVYVYYGNGNKDLFGGTSCASPLWAGFTALANQQAAILGVPPVGFINPALYEMASESIYDTVFHDTAIGDNTSPASPNLFHAKAGFDLCTGLGTPTGTNLINALINPDELVIWPNYGFDAFGTHGGPFNNVSLNYSITNYSVVPLTWSMVNTSGWLDVSCPGGTLNAGQITTVTISLNAAASNLMAGAYSAGIAFSNVMSGVGHIRHFRLMATDELTIQPETITNYGAAGLLSVGAPGMFIVSNSGPSNLDWTLVNTSAWFNLCPTNGSLAGNATATVTETPSAAADCLAGGFYTSTVCFENQDDGYSLPATVTQAPSQSILLNGGFETGDFTDWTLVGDTYVGNSLYNGVVDAGSLGGEGADCVHSGVYGAALGQYGYLADLSQTLTTLPGQAYLISLWLQNPTNDTGQEYEVNWNTNSSTTTTLIDVTNLGAFQWTNLTFIVSAADTNSTLEIGARNDNNVFGMDDVSVTPIPAPTLSAGPFSIANNTLTYSWSAVPGVQYQLEYTTNLTSGLWQVESAISATNYHSTWSIKVGQDPARFYRICNQPPPE